MSFLFSVDYVEKILRVPNNRTSYLKKSSTLPKDGINCTIMTLVIEPLVGT
jgi:hypothetical protein